MPAVYVNGQERTYPRGTTYETIVSEFQEEYGNHIALIYFNGKMRELNKKLERDGAIQLITTKDPAGHAAYVRTAIMMLVRAWKQMVPDSSLKVEFTLGNAYFVSVIGKTKITEALLQQLEETMREMAEKNLPIIKKTYPLDDAIALFHHQGMTDKEKLFRYRNSSTINIYCLDGYYDYYYGYMLPSTGYVRQFEITAYKEGLLLNLPEAEHPDALQPLQNEDRIYDQLMLSTKWGELVNISTVGDLNDRLRHDPRAGGTAGAKDRGHRRGHPQPKGGALCADRRPFLLRQDHLCPQALHSAPVVRHAPAYNVHG